LVQNFITALKPLLQVIRYQLFVIRKAARATDMAAEGKHHAKGRLMDDGPGGGIDSVYRLLRLGDLGLTLSRGL
jgi:hypothetical protein